MSYYAAALVRAREGWTAAELDLDEADDLDGIVELLRDVQPAAEVGLLFVEADDEFLVIVRSDDDVRVFGSDVAFAEESRVGEVLLDGTEEYEIPVSVADSLDDVVDDPEIMGQPVGDPDLIADLGVSGRDLLALCAHEGLLPSDVTLEISRKLGCADALVDLRGE